MASRKNWLPALIIGLAVMAVTALSGALLLQAGLRHSAPILADATRTGAAAVGEAVAGQFARALELGIPLDRLVGAETYLQRIAETSPQVGALALIDASGAIVASTGPDVRGENFPITVGETRATLVVAAVSPLFEETMWRIRISLGFAALLAGIVAAVLSGGYLELSWRPARARLLNAINRAAEGDFTNVAATGAGGPLLAASLALGKCVEQVEESRRRLAEAVATIRAIDFDGSLGRGVDAILRPLEGRYVLPDHVGEEGDGPINRPSAAGGIWRAAVIAGLYGASFPFVANFAVDRSTLTVPAAWVPVVPLLAELLALLLGVLVARWRQGDGRLSLALATALLGFALGATYWCRDYQLFVVLRCGAGFAAGLAGAVILGGARAWMRPRVLMLALLFSAFAGGPLLAGLLGESIGRRAAFLVLGVAILALTPTIAGWTAYTIGARARARSVAPRYDWITALTVLLASTLLLVLLPLGVGYDNYLAGGAVAALFGLGALAAPRLPHLAVAVALGAAALALHLSPTYPLAGAAAASLALGVAFGGAIRKADGHARGLASSLAIGLASGLVLAGLVEALAIPPAVAFAAVALLVAGRSVVPVVRPSARRG